MLTFNQPFYSEEGMQCISEAIIKNRRLNGDGPFTEKCTKWFEDKLQKKNLLTTSCTHALEMAALLADIQPGDEIIMPSFTFVSTADAFVLRGARIKFVDIRNDTMNINENLIEQAITEKTKVIVPVHYAGVACEMDTIMDLAKSRNLLVVEDAAQGMMATYKGRYLGTIGDFGAYSFHETKNYTMGEGGLILVNRQEHVHRAEILREKGTNRSQYFRGEVDKYSWVDMGSSYLPSEMNAAYLWPQLKMADQINERRLRLWNLYYESLKDLAQKEYLELPYIPEECAHNAHMFYIKVRNLDERTALIEYLAQKGISAVFHYVPLHSSIAGRRWGTFIGKDKFTTKESERLLRLPMFYDLQERDVVNVVDAIERFYVK